MSERWILLFIDGIGLAPPDFPDNALGDFLREYTGLPFVDADGPVFFDGGVLAPLDACLGVKGIPQSATGQTTIFTGHNAPAVLGYHLFAYPSTPLIDLIRRYGLPGEVRRRGGSATSLNLYTRDYFRRVRQSERPRFSVSTHLIMDGGGEFRYEEDYAAGKAVFMDLTGRLLRDHGVDVEVISPVESADNLLRVVREDQPDLTMFEYFLTDHFGHKMRRAALEKCLADLSAFTGRILEERPEGVNVMIVSDHGNAEDLSQGNHTRNPVPGLVFADEDVCRAWADKANDLTDITPFLLNRLFPSIPSDGQSRDSDGSDTPQDATTLQREGSDQETSPSPLPASEE